MSSNTSTPGGDDDVQEQPDNGDRVIGIVLVGRCFLRQGRQHPQKDRDEDTASPTVTPSAAHFGPSSTIAHNDPNNVVTQLDAWHGPFETSANWDSIAHAIWISTIYAATPLIAAWLVFRRRDDAS